MSIYDKANLVQIPSGYKASGAKLYSVLPANGDGDFTVSADADATRIDENGLIESTVANQARLNYDFDNPQDPHLLLEPTRTNLQVRSEEFDNADWTKSNCTVSSNQITSPDGATTADRLTGDTSTGNHYVQDVASGLSTSSEATLSVFVKKDEITQIELLAAQNTPPYTNWGRLRFDLDTLTTFQAPIGEYGYEDYGNGWIRLFITGTPTSTSAIIRFTLYKNDTSGWTGNDIDGFYLWGAQLEQGNYPTSYIPTTASAVTRTADTVKLENFTDMPTDYPFTAFWQGKIDDYDGSGFTSQVAFSLAATGTFNCYFALNFYSTSQLTLRRRNDTDTSHFITFSSDKDTTYKIAVCFISATAAKIYINGTEVLDSTSLTSVPYIGTNTPDSVFIAQLRDSSDTGRRNSCDQFILFNETLSDSELENLTSYDSFGQMAKALLYTIE